MSWLSPLWIYLLWKVFSLSICLNCLFGMVYLFSWYNSLANPRKHIWQIWSHKVIKWKHNLSLKCLFLNWLDCKTKVGHHYFKECSFDNNEYSEKCLGGGLSCDIEFDVMGFSPLVQKQMLVILCFRMIDKFTKCSVLIDGLWLKVVCQNILNISGFFGFLCVLLFFIFLGCLLFCFLLLFIILSCLFEQLEESCCFVAIQNNMAN